MLFVRSRLSQTDIAALLQQNLGPAIIFSHPHILLRVGNFPVRQIPVPRFSLQIIFRSFILAPPAVDNLKFKTAAKTTDNSQKHTISEGKFDFFLERGTIPSPDPSLNRKEYSFHNLLIIIVINIIIINLFIKKTICIVI